MLHYRFFGIIRASNGGENKPACTSFLNPFRMMSIYYSTTTFVRIKGSNMDSKEHFNLCAAFVVRTRGYAAG